MLALAVGLPLGVLVGRTDAWGRWPAALLHAFPMFLPPFVLGLGWFHAVRRVGDPRIRGDLASALRAAGSGSRSRADVRADRDLARRAGRSGRGPVPGGGRPRRGEARARGGPHPRARCGTRVDPRGHRHLRAVLLRAGRAHVPARGHVPGGRLLAPRRDRLRSGRGFRARAPAAASCAPGPGPGATLRRDALLRGARAAVGAGRPARAGPLARPRLRGALDRGARLGGADRRPRLARACPGEALAEVFELGGTRSVEQPGDVRRGRHRDRR